MAKLIEENRNVAKKDTVKKEDILTETSERDGAGWLVESILRRFRNLSFGLLLLPMVAVGVFVIGVSLVPAIYLVDFVRTWSAPWATPLHFLAIGISIALGFLSYGVTLMFVVPLVNFLMPFRVREFRGIWYSLPAIPWFVHNALTYIVRYTFLELMTPSPLNILYFRMMGMKIGKGCMINSSHISDPCMIEIGDHVTIGGSATIFAHYGQKGYLIISPVKIGHRTTIGLKASVMGGVTIGNDCTIKPHTALLPKTEVRDGEVV